MKIAGLLVATFLLATAQASVAPETIFTGEANKGRLRKAVEDARQTKALVVHNSDGGDNFEVQIAIQELIEHRINLQIYGYCTSACTFLLSVPGVCIARNARFAFHASYYLYSKEIAVEATKYVRDNLHPPGAREAWDKLGAYSAPWDKNVWIDTKILHEKDGIPWCPPRKFK